MKVEKRMVCGIDCRPGHESCNGYCVGQEERPNTFFVELDHAVITQSSDVSKLMLEIINLKERIRGEEDGYSLLYEVKEQLRKENEILRDGLNKIITTLSPRFTQVEIAAEAFKAADAVKDQK